MGVEPVLNSAGARRTLRRLELEAYASVVSALRAQGPLTVEKKSSLELICKHLGISSERHRAEIRRAVNDQLLSSVAARISGPESELSWRKEGQKLASMNPRFVSRQVSHLPTTLTSALVSSALGLHGEKMEPEGKKTTSTQVQSALKFIIAQNPLNAAKAQSLQGGLKQPQATATPKAQPKTVSSPQLQPNKDKSPQAKASRGVSTESPPKIREEKAEKTDTLPPKVKTAEPSKPANQKSSSPVKEKQDMGSKLKSQQPQPQQSEDQADFKSAKDSRPDADRLEQKLPTKAGDQAGEKEELGVQESDQAAPAAIHGQLPPQLADEKATSPEKGPEEPPSIQDKAERAGQDSSMEHNGRGEGSNLPATAAIATEGSSPVKTPAAMATASSVAISEVKDTTASTTTRAPLTDTAQPPVTTQSTSAPPPFLSTPTPTPPLSLPTPTPPLHTTPSHVPTLSVSVATAEGVPPTTRTVVAQQSRKRPLSPDTLPPPAKKPAPPPLLTPTHSPALTPTTPIPVPALTPISNPPQAEPVEERIPTANSCVPKRRSPPPLVPASSIMVEELVKKPLPGKQNSGLKALLQGTSSLGPHFEPLPSPIPPSPLPPSPIQPLPTQPSPTQPSPIQPSPIQPSPIQPSPTQPSPIQPSPIQPSPIQPSPIQPSPIQPSPAVSETSTAQTSKAHEHSSVETTSKSASVPLPPLPVSTAQLQSPVHVPPVNRVTIVLPSPLSEIIPTVFPSHPSSPLVTPSITIPASPLPPLTPSTSTDAFIQALCSSHPTSLEEDTSLSNLASQLGLDFLNPNLLNVSELLQLMQPGLEGDPTSGMTLLMDTQPGGKDPGTPEMSGPPPGPSMESGQSTPIGLLMEPMASGGTGMEPMASGGTGTEPMASGGTGIEPIPMQVDLSSQQGVIHDLGSLATSTDESDLLEGIPPELAETIQALARLDEQSINPYPMQ